MDRETFPIEINDEDILELSNKCINCLLCVQVCPILGDNTFATNTYPQMMVNLYRDPEVAKLGIDLAYQCLLCGECKIVCPRNIDTTKAVLMLRRKIINREKV